jgi:hypothetical protein
MAQIDIEKLAGLTQDAGKIFLTADGEDVLVQLLEIQQQVEAAIDAAEATLEQAALAIDPNFTSIQADKIKVFYRAYGTKYTIDESQLPEVPKELYTTKTTYLPDSKAIEKWVDEHKGLPVGIVEKERNKSLKFTLKGKKENE